MNKSRITIFALSLVLFSWMGVQLFMPDAQAVMKEQDQVRRPSQPEWVSDDGRIDPKNLPSMLPVLDEFGEIRGYVDSKALFSLESIEHSNDVHPLYGTAVILNEAILEDGTISTQVDMQTIDDRLLGGFNSP